MGKIIKLINKIKELNKQKDTACSWTIKVNIFSFSQFNLEIQLNSELKFPHIIL